MTKDNIKEYIVCINGGSGVLFQPLDTKYSYILTAKHVFDDLPAYNNQVKIGRIDPEVNNYIELEFYLTEGENYFPHKSKDVAILKISRLNGAASLIRIDDYNEHKFSLFGFPSLRKNNPSYLDRIREDSNLTFYQDKGEGKREYSIADNSTWAELLGQSGGGVFCIVGNYVGLYGIQNKVPNETESKGRAELSQLFNFDEIVEKYKDDLEPIIPSFLKSFKFLDTEIFKLKCGPVKKDKGDKLAQILVKKAKEIQESDITPKGIRDYLRKELASLHNNIKSELDKKKIWCVWLELLTVLNIAKNHPHSLNDLQSILKKIRLFYSDTDDDYWEKHLQDLPNYDYSGLEKGGVVIVASNVKAQDDESHILELGKIPQHITKPMKDQYDLNNSTIEIDNSSDYPLNKYRFMNISAFKEGTVNRLEDGFLDMDINERIKELKKKYEQLISH